MFYSARLPLIVLQNGQLRVWLEQLRRSWAVVWQLLLLVLEWYTLRCSSRALAVQPMFIQSLIIGINFFSSLCNKLWASNIFLSKMSHAFHRGDWFWHSHEIWLHLFLIGLYPVLCIKPKSSTSCHPYSQIGSSFLVAMVVLIFCGIYARPSLLKVWGI